MFDKDRIGRRAFLNIAAASVGAAGLSFMGATYPITVRHEMETVLRPIKQIEAGVLDVGYLDNAASDGPPVLLLHGWPYDIQSFLDVAPSLDARGCRVVVPHLRGHGTTRFLSRATPQSGQQATIGADVIALMDALSIPRPLIAGYDRGGRAACVAAALWPEPCTGLVSVKSYLIQRDVARAALPIAAKTEAGFWHQYYFQTEHGRAGPTANRIMWVRSSPTWKFDDATFDRSADTFDLDYVDVVIHSYRHRLGLAAGCPAYDGPEMRLAAQPGISVPTITLDGDADGVASATDGKSTAAKFVGGRQPRVIPNVGHNLPQEAPIAFASAVWELASNAR